MLVSRDSRRYFLNHGGLTTSHFTRDSLNDLIENDLWVNIWKSWSQLRSTKSPVMKSSDLNSAAKFAGTSAVTTEPDSP